MKLYSRNKKGKPLVWWIESDDTVNANGHIEINMFYGQVDGKIQKKQRLTKSGKNLGKANATTIQEQAKLDISYLYKAQRDKDYFESIDDYALSKKAMLASVLQDHWKKIKLQDDGNTFVDEYYFQPKLNGIRCMIEKVSNTEVIFLSRENLVFTYFKDIANAVLKLDMPIGARLDGELFNKSLKFEHICSVVNSETERYVIDPDTGAQLCNETDIQIHVYDYIKDDPNKTFKERLKDRDDMFGEDFTSLYIKKVHTEEVVSLSDLEDKYNAAIVDKDEGGMVRAAIGTYEYSYRSLFLFKYKKMKTGEFKITDIIEAENEPGKPIFVVTVGTNSCNVAIEGDKASNAIYLTDKYEYIGKWLSIRYQEKTRHGNLSFPVGEYIREGKEDEDGNFIPSV